MTGDCLNLTWRRRGDGEERLLEDRRGGSVGPRNNLLVQTNVPSKEYARLLQSKILFRQLPYLLPLKLLCDTGVDPSLKKNNNKLHNKTHCDNLKS